MKAVSFLSTWRMLTRSPARIWAHVTCFCKVTRSLGSALIPSMSCESKRSVVMLNAAVGPKIHRLVFTSGQAAVVLVVYGRVGRTKADLASVLDELA